MIQISNGVEDRHLLRWKLILNREMQVDALSSMFLREQEHVTHFDQIAPDHSAYLNRSNMYDLDGLKNRTRTADTKS